MQESQKLKMNLDYERKLEFLERSDKTNASKLRGLYQKKKKTLNQEDYLAILRSNLNIEEHHLCLVNCLISLFRTNDLGYEFVTVDPFSDSEEGFSQKNFDILFSNYRSEKAKILLIEIKGSCSRIGSNLSDFEEKKKIYHANIQIFEKKIVGEEISNVDFVLGVTTSDKDEILRHIKNNNLDLKELIIWSIDPFNRKVIEIYQSENHSEEIKKRRLHNDQSLDPLLKGLNFNLINNIDFTTKSHIIAILKYFYLQIMNKIKGNKKIGEPYIFSIDLIKAIIEDNPATKNLKKEEQEKFYNLIYKKGIYYNIFSKQSSTELKLNYLQNPFNIGEILINKYVKLKMEEDAQKLALEEFLGENLDLQKTLFN